MCSMHAAALLPTSALLDAHVEGLVSTDKVSLDVTEPAAAGSVQQKAAHRHSKRAHQYQLEHDVPLAQSVLWKLQVTHVLHHVGGL